MKLLRGCARIAAFVALLQPVLATEALARPRRHSVQAHASHPALWRLQGRSGTIFLFGTVHALPPHFEWENKVIRAAVQSSDRLVLEAVIDHDPTKSAATLLRLGAAKQSLPPVDQRVAPKFRKALDAMIQKSGAPREELDKLKTWAVGMVLFGVTVSGLGVSSADGVEEQLKSQFTAAGKPIEGLETLDQQLGFFDTLTEPQQRNFLESVVDQHADDAADFGRMLGAWSHGNEGGIAASFDRDLKQSDILRQVLLSRRNAHWADAIVQRLNRLGTEFLAVGAGHLAGPDSVQAHLVKLGYTAKRIQ